MPKELFGTDGIRGVPGTPPLDDGTLYATGRSLGNYLKETSPAARVLVGMDTRESGPHIAAVLAAGLGQSGVTVDFAGIITTPGVACLVRQRGFQAGVVISASHNPFHDNGVKLFSGAGMKFPDAAGLCEWSCVQAGAGAFRIAGRACYCHWGGARWTQHQRGLRLDAPGR